MDSYYTSGEGNVSVQTKEDTDYLYVTLGLNSNPGIWGIKNTVEFDSSLLELVSVTEGALVNDYVVETSTADGKYTLLAYRDNVKESYATGSFVTLTFKKSVEEIDLATALTLKNDQTIDDQAQAVNVDSIFNVGDFTSVPPSDDNQYLTDPTEIVALLHNALDAKITDTLIFYYKTTELVTADTLSGWFHSARASLDRYDRFGIDRYTATAGKYTKDGVYYYTVTYTAEYYLTSDQEIELDTKIATILNGLNIYDKTDLEKLSAVYAYLCENVIYDESAENCFTAYGALVEGKAVCQGYALAMMRLLNALNVTADVAIGTSGGVNHMWNVVKIDGEYFLLDSTWDSESEAKCYAYFLKGSDNFANHTVTENYFVTISESDHEDAYELSHSFSDTLSYDDDDHWYECKNCEAVNKLTAHTDANTDHVCDGGCASVRGTHGDTDKDHECDYGCSIALCAPTYTVTIPATVRANADLTVSAEGVVLYDTETLTVTVETDFMLTTAEGAKLPFTLGDGVTNGSAILSVVGNNDPEAPRSSDTTLTVTVTDEAKYAGTYTGTLIFIIAVNTASNN